MSRVSQSGRIFHSFSGRLAVMLLSLLLLFILVFSTTFFISEREKIQQDFLLRQNYTEKMLNQSVIWIDRGVYLYELGYQPSLEQAITRYREAYLSSGGNISELNLSNLKEEFITKYGGDWDLYLINADGIVEMTTFSDDLGLDFKKYPFLFERYTNIRNSDTIVPDRTVKGFSPGAPHRKFAYLGTPDHRYLLEISKNFKKFWPDTSKGSYHEMITASAQVNPDIDSIILYNTKYEMVSQYRRNSDDIPPVTAISGVLKVFKQHTTITESDPPNQTSIRYVYLPVEDTGSPSDSMMDLVCRIVYTNERVNTAIFDLSIMYLVFLGVLSLIVIIITYGVFRHTTRSLNQIVEDIDRIASGDLSHQIRHTGSYELQRIEQAINLMVTSLQKNISEIRMGREELRQELEMRRMAEKKYRALFNSAHNAIFILEDGIIRDCNQEAAKLIQRNIQEIIGHDLLTFSPKDQDPRASSALRLEQIMFGTSELESIRFIWDFIRPDGDIVKTIGFVNSVNIGETIMIQALFRDITELQELRMRQIRALSQIESNLTQFAVINDQIRNPLAIIVLLNDMQNGKFKEQINEQIKRMDELIDQMDRGFVETDKVREFLQKHYGLDSTGFINKKD